MNLEYYKNRSENSRFSTQYLEYDEYVFDVVPDSFFRLDMNEKVLPPKGTLVVSSYCLLFCPYDVLLPVYKILFSDMKSAKVSKSWSHLAGVSKKTTSIRIKLSNVFIRHSYQPFTVETEHQDIYSSKGVILAVANGLHDIVLQKIEQLRVASTNSKDRDTMIKQLISTYESKRTLNTKYISRSERASASNLATLFCHFEKVRGFFAVTGESLYFIPHSTCKSEPVCQVIPKSSIKYVLKQRYLHTDIALEVFLYGASSMFLVFDSQSARDNIYTSIGQTTSAEDLLNEKQGRWKRGEISNFEYLMFLNQISGRTVNEISLYPILPWLIVDNTARSLDLTSPEIFRDLAKPIGTLNDQKLISLKRLPESENFAYHKYCSNPDDIACLIARAKPDVLLQLRYANRSNISPDIQPQSTLIMGVTDAFNKVMTDPKFNIEAIPEFYEGDGELFVNNKRWIVNGSFVPNMTLPAWAKTASDFIRVNHQALECDYVTDHIHEWIDLTFGFKSAPQIAPQYDNMYNRASYKLNDDLVFGNVFTKEQRELYLLGQAPRQLFSEPHPIKIPTHRTVQAQLVDEREFLKKELSNLKEKVEERENALSQEREELETKMKYVLQEKDMLITELNERLGHKDAENNELKHNINDMEKKAVYLSKEVKRMTPKSDKSRPDDVRSVNRYILQLEKDLAESKKDEKMRVKELDQTHKLIIEYKTRLEAQKETCDRYYQKVRGIKDLNQQISDQSIIINRLRLENDEKENTIHKVIISNRDRDQELKDLKLENHTLAQQVRAMESILKDDFKAVQQAKMIRYLEHAHGRIKTQFKEEEDIEIDMDEALRLSSSASVLYDPVPLKSRLDNPANLDESTSRTVETSALLNESSQMFPEDFDPNNSVQDLDQHEIHRLDDHSRQESDHEVEAFIESVSASNEVISMLSP